MVGSVRLQEASLHRVDAGEIAADLVDDVLLVGIECDAAFLADGCPRHKREPNASRHARRDPSHLVIPLFASADLGTAQWQQIGPLGKPAFSCAWLIERRLTLVGQGSFLPVVDER